MLSEIHLLLTYRCNFACEHCFLYCSPEAEGTFTRDQIAEVLDQAEAMGGIEWIYFEGGEPFLCYPLMVEGIEMARARGFKAGIVTNGYWATSEEEAERLLAPLKTLGVGDLSMSDDGFHGSAPDTPVRIAARVARRLGLPVNLITVEPPDPGADGGEDRKGATIVGGDVKFVGRAADRLTAGLPRAPANHGFTACPHEDLRTPQRVHVDCHGNVHMCQGLTIGSIWETPLAEMFAAYEAADHPVCGPIAEGGPSRLAAVHGIAPGEAPVDACHLCFMVRRALLDRFPQYLTPRLVYGRD